VGLSVGVVGKPNVGKSTFFSAATLAHVAIANYPFTTIKPNRGVGYVRTPCVCKELDVQDNPSNSACVDGTRLIPVELVDCAGLVPGAWQGRGLGNQFLDEIRQADALIHIVDAAGATDIEGKPCDVGTHDPREDVRFLETELDMWLLQIVKKDWEKTTKRVEGMKEDLGPVLEERLSGLGVKRFHVTKALTGLGLDATHPSKWSEDQLLRFLHEVRSVTKPMLIAANKIDIPIAKDNTETLEKLGYPVIPCCAEAELALRRTAEKNLTDYTPGDSNFKITGLTLSAEQKTALDRIREKILIPWGSTGVQAAIDYAFFKMLRMITVYPVENPENLSDHKGRVLPDAYLIPFGTTAKQFAGMVHSDLGEGFLYGVDVRSKMRVGEEQVLKDRDVISIVSAKKRG
jgi:ribosome-binding ATPase YchF (GTP1/OBG family)